MRRRRLSSRSKLPSESPRVAKKIYFVAGEASADDHGAELIRALKERAPDLHFAGRGGPQMRAAAGGAVRDWIEEAAVVGLWEVLRRYGFFRKQFRQTIAEIASLHPAAVVLIDYPGFNLRLARALREKFPSLKIIYYISPQVWAWNRGRVRQMKNWLDLVLCIFPFEPDLYKAAGLPAIFVGHPMAIQRQASNDNREGNLVGLFPGSRRREVQKIFPVMHQAALNLSGIHPDLHFEVAAASPSLARLIRNQLGDSEKISIVTGAARQLMARARVAMIASGTATLEAALAGLPFVLVYRVAWLTYFAARLVVQVKHLGMPNVLANREIVPEFIQHQARPRQIAESVARLLSDESERARMLRDFESIAGTLKQGQTSANAAEAILAELQESWPTSA